MCIFDGGGTVPVLEVVLLAVCGEIGWVGRVIGAKGHYGVS